MDRKQQRLIHLNLILTVLIAILTSSAIQAKEPDWTDYAALLKQYVSTSEHHGVQLNWVNYSQLKKDIRWNSVVAQMEAFSPHQLSTRQERLAFYINAYNIMTIKVVIDNWPLESIKDVGNFLWPVWRQTAGKIGQEKVTLDEIEHEILRPMAEPRIHFSIVCASISCPSLRQEPFTSARLERQLEEQTANFLSNRKKGLFQDGSNIHVSQIFSWFAEDFTEVGGVRAFIENYTALPEVASIKTDIPYNWQVNGE